MRVNLKDFNIVHDQEASSLVVTETATTVVFPLLNGISRSGR